MSTRTLVGFKQQGHALLVESIPIGDAQPDPRNPRKHSPHQIAQLCTSIRTFGYNSPILLSEDGHIVAGHARVQACRELGWTEVPAIRLRHLTKAQAKA